MNRRALLEWRYGVPPIMLLIILILIILIIVLAIGGSASANQSLPAGEIDRVKDVVSSYKEVTPPGKLTTGALRETYLSAPTEMDESKFKPKGRNSLEPVPPPDKNIFRRSTGFRGIPKEDDLDLPCFITGVPIRECKRTSCLHGRRGNDNSR